MSEVQYFVEFPMFAEDRWAEGIYTDLAVAERVASVSDSRTLYSRVDKKSPWIEMGSTK